MEKTVAEQTRAFRMSLDLDASPDEVWRALTEAEELVRWFPPDARVTPDVGDPVGALAANEDVARAVVLVPERRHVWIAVLGQRTQPTEPGAGQKLPELVVGQA